MTKVRLKRQEYLQYRLSGNKVFAELLLFKKVEPNSLLSASVFINMQLCTTISYNLMFFTQLLQIDA